MAAVRHWAVRKQILDLPNPRSSHSRPTPRGGGLIIVAVTLGGLVLVAVGSGAVELASVLAFALGGTLIAGVSWLDDLHSLPARTRLGAHFAAAAMAVAALGYWHPVRVPFLGHTALGWVGVAVALTWIVGLTNAYNFMDGIDGIAGAQAVVAGLGWFALAGADPVVRALGLLLAATSAGFLVHNWPPARIFMGDVGSAFIGYIFAVMALEVSLKDLRFVLVGFLLVWPFVFDTSFTFFRRLLRHENVLAAHRSHLYQRLVIAGFSHQFVTLLYAALAALGVGLARIWLSGGPFHALIVFAGLVAATVGLLGLVWWAEKAPRSS